MLVIDSQIHVFGPRGRELPALAAHRHLSEAEILNEMDSAGVTAAVLVPARPDPSATNELVLDIAARMPSRFGVMGKLSLDEESEARSISGWPDSGLLGYRVSFPPGVARVSDPQNAWIFQIAQDVGAPLMVWAPGQLDDIARVASEYPQVRLAIDHLGLAVADKDEAVAGVAKELTTLAAHPNIAVKASGMPGHTSASFPYLNLHQPIRDVIDAFGPERVFWGTDLTTLPCSYQEAVRMFDGGMDLTEREAQQILGLALAGWLNWTPE